MEVKPIIVLVFLVAVESTNDTDIYVIGRKKEPFEFSGDKCLQLARIKLKRKFVESCVKYICKDDGGGDLTFVVNPCQPPVAPDNAQECVVSNEWSTGTFPACCDRLRCIITKSSKNYMRIIGQPEETFPDIDLDEDYQQGDLDTKRANMALKKRKSNFEYEDDDSTNTTGGVARLGSPDGNKEKLGDTHTDRRPTLASSNQTIHTKETHNFLEWMIYPIKQFFLSRYRILGVKIKVKTNVTFKSDWTYDNQIPI